MRVLVLDDNADVLESLALVLEAAGHEPIVATDGAKALALNSARPADLLITDIFMPGTDGLEAIAQFRARWPGLRIVAMSGGGALVKQDYLESARWIGADALLRKPFEPVELLKALERLVPHAG